MPNHRPGENHLENQRESGGHLPLREMLLLADQASEAGLKTLPGSAWGIHYGQSAGERTRTMQALLDGQLKPENLGPSLRPGAIVYDIEDLHNLGIEAVSAKIRDYSATIMHYDYQRYADFLWEMRGTGLDLHSAQRLYEGLIRSRVRKKMHDAYGYTGRKQIETSLQLEADKNLQNLRDYSPLTRVLQTLKLEWLQRSMNLLGSEQLDEVLEALSAPERELYDRLSEDYRLFVQKGDMAAYGRMLENLSAQIDRISKPSPKETPQEELEKLQEQLEDFMDQGGLPGTPGDQGIPPEDSDEYHTPEPAGEGQNAESAETQEQKPIFTIRPSGTSSSPLTGNYCSGRKSYYDPARKTWSKKKQLVPYHTSIDGAERQTIAGRTGGGLVSLPIPAQYALDATSLQSHGAALEILRDQNGCFYIKTDGPAEFAVDFLAERPVHINPPVPEDTAPLYSGSLSQKTEIIIAALAGDNLQQAAAARTHLLQNHAYPGGGDLKLAGALQAKLRKHPAEQYIQALDRSEYLECYSANTLFIAMLRKAGVPARLVIGHKVTSAANNEAHITQSTGHAWAEVWDGHSWRRFDATPAPRQEDKKPEDGGEGQEDQQSGQSEPADDGGIEGGAEQQPGGDQPENSEQSAGGGQSAEGDQPGDLTREVQEAVADQEQSLEESLHDLPETQESQFNEAQQNLTEAGEKMEQMQNEKKQIQQQLEQADTFQQLEQAREKIEQADLIDEIREELERQAEAKKEQMLEEMKRELEQMADDGFLDEQRREELLQQLEEKNSRELDQVRRQIEEESGLHDQYEEIKAEVGPLVEEWYRYFVEKLPRADEIMLDQDSITRRGVFDRRSVMRPLNLLLGTVKNPFVIKPDIKPKFIASIVLDVSGSMAGPKLEMARKLLVFYCELFARISAEYGYVRFSIDTFSDGITSIKDYDHDYDSNERYQFESGVRETIKARLMKRVACQGGTNMLDAIQNAARRLSAESFNYPDYASAMYFVGDGGDGCGNSENIKKFMRINDEEHGFGTHMYSAVMLGGKQERQILADLFGDEHTTVAATFPELIEQNMLRFDEDISSYLENKTF